MTKVLAVVGVVLTWFPIAATMVTSAGSTLGRGAFHLDWLMPAELFPAAAIGGVLLLWAALRARSRVKPIAWSLVLMGVRRLYISATPSENTINFYLSLGCVVTQEPDAELFELEPEDIHLEYVLPTGVL